MARPKEFNRDQVLEKAMGLFWEKGYDGSSVEDLVQCTGIGRGSLYDTFGDKHALYLAALDRYMSASSGPLTALQRYEGPFRDALRDFFEGRIEEAFSGPTRHGCFMVNAGIELAPHDSEVAAKVQAGLDETEEAFYHVLIKAQATGELSWKSDSHRLARFLLNTLLGIRVLSRAHPDRQMLQDIVETALATLG
ncbi:putative HTH-type transcriptional regulator YezE [Dictyobacter alpinus]|uniref:Putative HTH-type transcriptional regulator YezE n=1 Tax=Dictyobacter alpinus TaxID=2014873 RepID=A0A402BFD8_9CHLR|nr:TetR/AcrR family transcriptional regulator [Dictyobacter alpinus]GCE29992.1 putative HTH-type transcriptional regulator YezE [Dictyobacter alpinus]